MTDRQTLSRAAGRLIVGKVAGTKLDSAEIDALRQGIMGGITIFKQNVESREQLAGFVAAIREHSCHEPLIAVDQEGGAVQRFDKVLTPLPAAMALAAGGSLEQVRAICALNARQLQLLGINCLLAPVLDVLSNALNPVIGTRSFGSDPRLVREFGLAATRAFRDAGIMAVGKHFPGHGDTLEDSHLRLAVGRSDARTLWQRELVPFRGCLQHLPAVLTGHIWLPAVDHEELPASLSPRVTSGLLRHYLGFEGVVVTDDLLMEGITGRWGLGEAAVKAVLAGADLLLVCGDLEAVRTAHEALVQAIECGRIHESLVRKSSERIALALHFLPAAGKLERADLPERLTLLTESVEHGYEAALAASLSAVAALRGSVPDLGAEAWTVVVPQHPVFPLSLARYLAPLAPAARIAEQRYPLDPGESEIRWQAESCRGKNVILLTFRALKNHGQIDLAAALAGMCPRKIA
ncbi:MAG TPA: beta-N-acetylhexosaminidase, partial [Candidatus Obscuribacterales bacterium]